MRPARIAVMQEPHGENQRPSYSKPPPPCEDPSPGGQGDSVLNPPEDRAGDAAASRFKMLCESGRKLRRCRWWPVRLAVCGTRWRRCRTHRRAKGRRCPLASLLLIAVAALLSGRRNQLAIVRWGRKLTADALASIGISRARVLAPSVWCELVKGLDVDALKRALGNWVRGEQPAAMSRSMANGCAAVQRHNPRGSICWRRSAHP